MILLHVLGRFSSIGVGNKRDADLREPFTSHYQQRPLQQLWSTLHRIIQPSPASVGDSYEEKDDQLWFVFIYIILYHNLHSISAYLIALVPKGTYSLCVDRKREIGKLYAIPAFILNLS